MYTMLVRSVNLGILANWCKEDVLFLLQNLATWAAY